MKFLYESINEVETTSLLEEGATQKSYFISGPFLLGESPNLNKRIYPKNVLDKGVKLYEHKIQENRAMGELNHPQGPGINPTTINLDRVSHKILYLREDGNNYVGKAKIIDTPMGNIVRNLMDEGIKFGVSLRALGSVNQKNGYGYVQEDFHLITPADIVSDPSAAIAMMDAIYEGKEWLFNNGSLIEKENTIKDFMNEQYGKKQLNEDAALLVFEYVLKQI